MKRIVAALVLLAFGWAGVAWLRDNVRLAWNETDSLPQALFLVRLGSLPGRGDFVMFRPPERIGSTLPFVKKVAGVPGDGIALRDGTVFVAGARIGKVKKKTKSGRPLRPIAPGTVPPGHYFVFADHEDSYDSRYEEVGLAPRARIIGRAVALF